MLLSSTGFDLALAQPLDRVGRDGLLSLAFERQGGRTVLIRRRFTLPLQALEAIPLDSDGSVCLMLLNPTGGLVGGDHLRTEVTLGRGTHVCLTTPSATKVYRSLGSPAIQETSIKIGEGAILEYLPDHVIPHPGSVFHQSLTLEMGSESRAILVDAFAVGRLARGERWSFRELVNRISVSSCGRPLFLDWIRLDPSTRLPAGLGGMEGFGYHATLALFGECFDAWESMARALEEELSELRSVLGGVSLISRGGCVVRLLAASAPDLTQAVRDLWTLAREVLLGLPAVDIRKW